MGEDRRTHQVTCCGWYGGHFLYISMCHLYGTEYIMLLTVHNVFMFKVVCADLCCMLWSEIWLYVSAVFVNGTMSSAFGLQSVSWLSLL